MTRMPATFAVVIGLAATIGLGSAAWLARLPAVPIASRPASDARFVPLSPDAPLVQTIAPPWDGLTRLRIRIKPETRGNAELVVRISAGEGRTPLETSRLVIVPIAQADEAGYLNVRVDPLPISPGVRYAIALTARPPGAGVAVWVNPHGSYPGGSLSGAGVDDGDLVFAALSAARQPAAFLRAVLVGRPAPLDTIWALAVVVALFACASAWLVVEAWRAPDEGP